MTPPSPGATYRDAGVRIDGRVRALAAEGRSPAGIAVPACPGWTVHDVVAHLTGVAADVAAGRLRGVPDEDQTAEQVASRTDRAIGDVLDEWAGVRDGFAQRIDEYDVFPAALDALTHEGDIAEALGDAAPPRDAWQDSLRRLGRERIGPIDRPGSLTVRSDGDTWTGGAGGDGPAAVVEVEPWELFRGLMSRLGRERMRAWPWEGDPDPWLDRLPVFGFTTGRSR